MPPTARRLIEEALVTPGNRRNSVVDNTLLSDFHVTPDFLDTLVDKSALLRKEARLDDFSRNQPRHAFARRHRIAQYAPRTRSKPTTKKAEYRAQLAEEAKRREAVEARVPATRKQRKMARTVAITSLLTLLVCLGFYQSVYIRICGKR